jgi:hypothetical protein
VAHAGTEQAYNSAMNDLQQLEVKHNEKQNVVYDNKYFELMLSITALYLLQIWKTNGKLQRWFTRTWLSECKVMYWYIKYIKY